MFRAAFLALVAALLAMMPATPAVAQGVCSFCDTKPPPKGQGGGRPSNNPGNGNGNGGNSQALDLSVETDIDFGRIVMIGGGSGTILLDLSTGQRITSGSIDDLGGLPMRGRAVISGGPMRVIRITMPDTVTMTDPTGGTAILRDIVTDLPALPVLDTNGQLEFHFTGTLVADPGAVGNLRGRIPIRVQYD